MADSTTSLLMWCRLTFPPRGSMDNTTGSLLLGLARTVLPISESSDCQTFRNRYSRALNAWFWVEAATFLAVARYVK